MPGKNLPQNDFSSGLLPATFDIGRTFRLPLLGLGQQGFRIISKYYNSNTQIPLLMKTIRLAQLRPLTGIIRDR